MQNLKLRHNTKPAPRLNASLNMAFIAILFVAFGACAQTKSVTSLKTVKSKAGSVSVQTLASFNEPWGMTFLPDGRLLVTEKPGRLKFYSEGKVSEPITGVPEIAYGGQGGLMDVEIDPNFTSNNLVYLYYVEGAPGGDLKGGAVATAKLNGNALQDVKVLWRQVPKVTGGGHFGGRLVFAPDGKLFITSGERQKFDPAQDSASNLGKIVRINLDGSIPNDNPFVNRQGVQPDIWSMGHRNPLGAAINPVTKALWVNEMGPRGGDEVNVPDKGKNYGWPIVSNGDHYDGRNIPDHPTRPEFAAPAISWNPVISPSGMMFYTGNLFPEWNGSAFIGGLSSQALIRITTEGNSVTGEERIDMGQRIRDMIQAADGSIWVLTDGGKGELWRLSPAGK